MHNHAPEGYHCPPASTMNRMVIRKSGIITCMCSRVMPGITCMDQITGCPPLKIVYLMLSDSDSIL